MNDHKKFKSTKKQPASLDGMLSNSPRLGAPVKRAYRNHSAVPGSGLGSIQQAEGFTPVRSSGRRLGATKAPLNTEALLEEPIILDEATPKRRHHYFGHKRPKLRKFLKWSSLTVLFILLIGAGYFGVKFYLTEKHLFRGGGSAPALAQNVDINRLKGEGDGRVNVLLLGVGGPGHDGPDLTDTIMVASIDPVNYKVTLLSVPRDLWVKIPGFGYQKINAAFPDGKQASKSKDFSTQEKAGLAELDKTLEPVLGINIHYHVLVDFSAFKQTVDALGGVTVNVPEQLYDPTIAWENKNNPVIAAKGEQTFNGQKALLYAKSRETSSDFARGERQRLLLVAIKEKVLNLGTFSNPIKVSSLLDSLGNNVYTDFASGDVSRVYQIASQIPSNQITSLDMVTPPNTLLTTGNMNGLSIVEPRAGLFEYDDIRTFVRTNLRDGFLAKENAKVAVYNATGISGLATTQGALLKTYGYNVGTVENAPTQTSPQHTIVVDLTKGADKYTRHYLEGRYKTTAVSKVPADFGITPPTDAKFVIILGNDVANSR